MLKRYYLFSMMPFPSVLYKNQEIKTQQTDIAAQMGAVLLGYVHGHGMHQHGHRGRCDLHDLLQPVGAAVHLFEHRIAKVCLDQR